MMKPAAAWTPNLPRHYGLQIALCCVLAMTACYFPPAHAGEPAPIKLILFEGINASGIYVAQDKGFFAQEGLQVEISDTPNSIYLMTGLIDGTYQMAQASIDNFFAYQSGQSPVSLDQKPELRVVLGGTTMRLDLVVSQDINSYEDIKGEMLGVDAASTGWAFVLREMLKRGGLSTNDYGFIETGNTAKRVDALIAGEYKATLLVGNYINQAYAAGFKKLDDNLSRLGAYQGSSIGLNQKWAENNRESVVAFIRAYVRAMDVIKDENQRDAVVEIVTRHTGMQDSIARQTLRQFTSGDYGFTPRAALDSEGVDTVLKLRQAYGTPAADFSRLEDYVDLTYYQEALRSLAEPR